MAGGPGRTVRIDAVGQSRAPVGAGGLEDFLADARLSVLDVRRGAALGTRRLLLGAAREGAAQYVAVVADLPGSTPGIDTELRTLHELRTAGSPTLRATLPDVVASISVDARPAVVLTATPGLRVGAPIVEPPVGADTLGAVRGWLGDLWRCTAGVSEPVELGRAATDRLLARGCGSRRLGPTLGAVHGARSRLEHHRVNRTAVHGCLCSYHAQVQAGEVTGVDDWSVASLQGEPLRDLGGYAVRHAGSRLPEVVAGRTGHAHQVRDFVVAGLAVVGLPDRHWRDVLLLAQVERAVDGLERGRVDQMTLLAAAVQALPRDYGRTEAAS
jgi:hypothetical protein